MDLLDAINSITSDPQLVTADKFGLLDLRSEFAIGGKKAGLLTWGDAVVQQLDRTKDLSTGNVTTTLVTSKGKVVTVTDIDGNNVSTVYTSPSGTIIDL